VAAAIATAPTAVDTSLGAGRASSVPVDVCGSSSGDVPEWLEDLFQQQRETRPRGIHKEIVVPQFLVPRLIGRGGEVINSICQLTGADIKFRQETKELGYSIAVITGRKEAMEAGERLVQQKMGVAGSDFEVRKIDVSSEHVSAIIGAKGHAISEVRARAGGIQIEIRPPDVPGLPHRAILGPARPEQIAAAERLLADRVAALERDNAAGRPSTSVAPPAVSAAADITDRGCML